MALKLGKILRIIKAVMIIFAIIFGVTTGLFVGGGIYPLIDRIGPAVEGFPWIGTRLYPFLEQLSPPLTGYERRKLELETKEDFLRKQEEELRKKMAALEAERKSLQKEKKALEKQFEELRAKESESNPKKSVSDIMGEAVAQMPASKAAKILVKLPIPDVVALLELMDSEQRMQVLGKMPPEVASKIIYYAREKIKGAGAKGKE